LRPILGPIRAQCPQRLLGHCEQTLLVLRVDPFDQEIRLVGYQLSRRAAKHLLDLRADVGQLSRLFVRVDDDRKLLDQRPELGLGLPVVGNVNELCL
jgi:hypothetical protein